MVGARHKRENVRKHQALLLASHKLDLERMPDAAWAVDGRNVGHLERYYQDCQRMLEGEYICTVARKRRGPN